MQFCFAKLQTSSAPFGGTFPKGEGIGTLNSNIIEIPQKAAKLSCWIASRLLNVYAIL